MAVLLCAGRAQAEDEPQPAAEELPEPQPPQPPQLLPQAQPQPMPQQLPPMPNGYQPTMNWRPLEVSAPTKEARSIFSWSELPFGVAGDLRTFWPQDSATRRLVGKKTSDNGGLSISYDVLKVMDRVVARVDLGWGSASNVNASPSSTDEEKLRTQLVTLGLSLRYHVLRWLAPYARVAGGVGWDKVTVGSASGEWQDKHTFAHGSVGGGLFLRSPTLTLWPSHPTFGLALMGSIEGGYFLAPSSKLSLQASSDPDIKNPIPTASVPIGTMGRSAPYLRVTVGLAF
jgi:hypothetical protein